MDRWVSPTTGRLACLVISGLALSGCTSYCTGAAAQGPIFMGPAALVVGAVSKAGCAIRENSRNAVRDGGPAKPDGSEPPSAGEDAQRRD